ncbi:dTMP kinase [Pacificimonas sp. WHA3]|uniref:Thymidylate kinase n=1 Tax=Pacificimonas pallii TaxID=2827236 RepID=A0ABS6SG86_9SPHN|nr:dTMP kinase [Pacificimonas pallii]MBV7256931.1 dTMP kinase [Pacificimonas pallii]
MTGRFISFEGGEGAGKTTQIKRLAERLRGEGQDVVLTREPGGTPGAEAIRELLVTGETGRWNGRTEALLMNAARADHVARLILPALGEGKWVLCDRFGHSTLAYQGVARGMDLEELLALHNIATEGLWPAKTLLFDLPVRAGLARAGVRGGTEARFEGEALAFHEKVRAGFLALAKQDKCMTVIDAERDADAVAAHVWRVIEPMLRPLP